MYQLLEYIAFGRDLEKTRATFVDRLSGCRNVVIYGAGDGRCFRTLLPAAPLTNFVSVEVDPEMSRLARTVVADLGGMSRVQFIDSDARMVPFTPAQFDGVVTQFFLDCFPAEDLERLIPAIGATLGPGAVWLFADFAIPERPAFARWRARAWIALLCAFFRWQAGHVLKTLPPMEPLLSSHGFRCECERARSWGLLRSAIYRKAETIAPNLETDS